MLLIVGAGAMSKSETADREDPVGVTTTRCPGCAETGTRTSTEELDDETTGKLNPFRDTVAPASRSPVMVISPPGTTERGEKP